MNTKTVLINIQFKHDPGYPNVLEIEGPQGYIPCEEGGHIYFSESDGTKIAELSEAFLEILPKGTSWEDGGQFHLPFISHWDDDALAKLAEQSFEVRYAETWDKDDLGDHVSSRASVPPAHRKIS